MSKRYFLLLLVFIFTGLSAYCQTEFDRQVIVKARQFSEVIEIKKQTIFYLMDYSIEQDQLEILLKWKATHAFVQLAVVYNGNFNPEKELYSVDGKYAAQGIFFIHRDLMIALADGKTCNIVEYLCHKKFNISFQLLGDSNGVKLLVDQQGIIKGVVAREVSFDSPFFEKALQSFNR